MADKASFRQICRMIHQRTLGRYAITGILSFVIDCGLFQLLYILFGNHPVGFLSLTTVKIFNAIGMVSGFLFSFIMNRKWSFRSAGNIPRQFVLCILLLCFNTWVVSAALNFVEMLHPLDWVMLLAKMGFALLVGIWNYFLYKHVIYR